MSVFSFTPVGTLRTCFPEKFGIPRQAGLAPEARARLIFFPEFAREELVRGLEGFSHVWIVYVFHRHLRGSRSPMVRPPRLGGNRKAGVFATRAPFRPAAIGLSAVELSSVEQTRNGPVLHLAGVDMLDHTPVLDIKPYLTYSDSIPHARAGFAAHPPGENLLVHFSPRAAEQLRHLEDRYPDLQALIIRVLSLDPRPGYRAGHPENPDRVYGMRLHDVEIKWQVRDTTAVVVDVGG